MDSCPRCRAPLGSPLVCESCGALLPAGAPDPFRALGLLPAFALDRDALRTRVLALSRRLHPDFFANAPEAERELAERNTAELNAAHLILADDVRRADWLVKHLGGPGEDEERAMPAPFLQEVLEWNEAIEEARRPAAGADARAALDGLARSLEAERAALIERAGALLDPLPARGSAALVEARKLLNATRYLDRALREIAELKLAEASSAR